MKPSKILCIGRNYARHAAEMSSSVPTEPIVFLKPPSALINSGEDIVLPRASSEVQHEVELVVRIARIGKSIPREHAMQYVDGYAVGLDVTARDIQAEAKKKGAPWAVAKGFDTFAPVGDFAPGGVHIDPHALDISLTINGEIRQSGNTRDMIFDIPYLIEFVSEIFTVFPGDLIFTGTPDGVGPIMDGDELEATIEGLPVLRVRARNFAGS